MCLAIPMKITKINDGRAVAEARGVETVVNFSLYPDVKEGDTVIVHAGFIIEKLDEEAARETEKIWDEYLKMLGDEEIS
ncbi:MAG: hypothetical protein A2W19_11580 [Spirochaetes bacterium RBG_16_49_21]|nr:MAG: hypothetical protein A2W19_11580 [Spirochaetes bacterium RBG_16_49_21]